MSDGSVKSASVESTIDAATLARIGDLCAAADREWTSACAPSGNGGTCLAQFRDILIERAKNGMHLPEQWHHMVDNGFETICLKQRLEQYGTTDWRKAYPWLAENRRNKGLMG